MKLFISLVGRPLEKMTLKKIVDAQNGSAKIESNLVMRGLDPNIKITSEKPSPEMDPEKSPFLREVFGNTSPANFPRKEGRFGKGSSDQTQFREAAIASAQPLPNGKGGLRVFGPCGVVGKSWAVLLPRKESRGFGNCKGFWKGLAVLQGWCSSFVGLCSSWAVLLRQVVLSKGVSEARPFEIWTGLELGSERFGRWALERPDFWIPSFLLHATCRSARGTGDQPSTGIVSKRWIQNPNRCADEYLDRIEDFIEFARRHNPGATRIRCPCRRCNNTLWETIENVGFHLVRNGMIETYSIWNFHGEQLDHAFSSNATRMDSVEPIMDPNDQVMDIIQDAFPFASTNLNHEREDDVPTPIDSAEFEQYEKLLKNANQELYPGCESFSVLRAIVELMHRKIKYRMSNLYSDYFLGVFKRMLPTNICLPKGHKHAQKEHETLDTCPICNESRFKMTSQNRTTKIPEKVMRYLPLKPRLQ
ncbi:hypothetical protein L3X38_042214 [Prunus dulcis]|uniref:Transposase-associated domain-containing protein n=1 Tax=Prunus dulcis TaxID=3755 RepID=A0AAD4UUF5_PRUDU|nr:hypothetical protein L3X38_042214 [Prunus dulcis]